MSTLQIVSTTSTSTGQGTSILRAATTRTATIVSSGPAKVSALQTTNPQSTPVSTVSASTIIPPAPGVPSTSTSTTPVPAVIPADKFFPLPSKPAIAIAGASIAAVLLLALLCFLYYRRRKQHQHASGLKLTGTPLSISFPKSRESDLEKCLISPPASPSGKGKRMSFTGEAEQHPAFRQLPRPVPLVHLVPPAEPHPGTLVLLRSSRSSNFLSSYSLPGQRYPPLKYPPPGVPSQPSRVSSKHSQRRPSTRSNRLEPGEICFLPGAGRHSISDGIIPTQPRAQTPRSSESSSVSQFGKLTLHHPSTETLPSPFGVEGIEEEGLGVGSGSSSIEGLTATETSANILQLSLPAGESTVEGERISNSSGSLSRTPSPGASVSEQRTTPPTPRTPIPTIPENGVDEALSLSPHQQRNGTSALALNMSGVPETSRLLIRNTSSSHSLREQHSQTFLSISSRSGSSVALVDDEPKETSNGGSFSRRPSESWWNP
ncbi:hypothetical protein K440DRAFT_659243 [Wilcoxina mikolae CBS 423.85]|nr:hypothetical protein K440DRAFT_659243 [Wilcoxina mikolae CBS 423.85]